MTPDEFLERTGLADRTVRLYHQQGLLSEPGRDAQYGELHLLRVMAIPLLRGQGIRGPGKIKNALDSMSIEDLRSLVEGEPEGDGSVDVTDAPADPKATLIAALGGQQTPTAAPVSETHVHVTLRDGIVLDVRMPLDEDGRRLLQSITFLCGLKASLP